MYKPKSLIPVYEPHKAKNQRKYVLDCIDSNWISSRGDYIDKFEKSISKALGISNTLSTFNGSVSLLLILRGLNIGYGDEVITPSLTYAATISSINLSGSTAVLVDSDNNFQMDLDKLKQCLSKKTKAIMVPELYSDAPDMNYLIDFCNSNSIHLIEDSAEAFNCFMPDGKAVGSLGVASSFSFFANKNITTGEGGCVCTNNLELSKKLRLLKSQSHIGGFIHDGPGHNFRMTNIQAAIGTAQLEELAGITHKKKALASFYRTRFEGSPITNVWPSIDSSEWMPVFKLPNTINYSKFQSEMSKKNVDTRSVFTPIHLMKGFDIKTPVPLTNCEEIYKLGFNLPSFPDLNENQLKYIVNSALEVVNS